MPPTPPAGIQDAARHLAEERAGEAIDVLERLVGEFPAYVTAHVLLAKSYEAHGRLADALGAWHHAYFLMPGSPLVLRERARLLRAESAPAPAGPAPADPEPPAETKTEAEQETAYVLEADPSLIDEVDDLDGLIEQLENAPRILPGGDFDDTGLDVDEGEEDELVSETLARIYESQGQHEAAARAYEQLAMQQAGQPERAAELRGKAAELRRRTEGQQAGR